MSEHESMTPERLAEIRARVENRTPGTWQWGDHDELIAQDGDDFASVIYGSIPWPEDRDLIANAPQDLEDLLAEVECLRARLTVDDDMLERAARAFYGCPTPGIAEHLRTTWDRLATAAPEVADNYRRHIRAALDAALGTEEDS